MWKGDTAEAPSGTESPEGSIKGPGLDTTREPRESRGVTEINSNANPAPSLARADGFLPLLWNNMYACLADVDEEETAS